MTSNFWDLGLKTTDGSPATANFVGMIGSTPGVFEKDVNGAKLSGAQVSPPSVENENPQPSLNSQSFQAPASHCPSELMPSDSSLFAYTSFVTSRGVEGVPRGLVTANATAASAAAA